MDRAVIAAMVDLIDGRFDRNIADRFAALPRRPDASATCTRVLSSLPMDIEGYRVADAVMRAALAQDPSAVIAEEPNSQDDGGLTLVGGPWSAAEDAAIDAMTAYAWPDLVTPEERELLVDRWEAVLGPLRPLQPPPIG